MIKIPIIKNIGAGTGQTFKQETASNENELRTIAAGTGIGIANNANDITITNSLPENTTVANVGAGTGLVYRDKTSDQINLKRIAAGSGISVTNGADDITIATSTSAKGNIYLPGSSNRWVSLCGSPVVTAFQWQPGSTNGWGTGSWQFNQNDGACIGAMIAMPEYYDGLTIRGRLYFWTNNTGSANDVKWKVGFLGMADGDSVETNTTKVTAYDPAATYRTMRITPEFTLVPTQRAAALMALGISVWRENDSYASPVYFAGLQLMFGLT